MKGVKTLYESMTVDDWKYSKNVDFETMKNEIYDQLQKWVDMKIFNKATDKQYALIDAAIATMYIVMEEGAALIEKAGPKKKCG